MHIELDIVRNLEMIPYRRVGVGSMGVEGIKLTVDFGVLEPSPHGYQGQL